MEKSNFLIIILMFILIISSIHAAQYNTNGDFSVEVEELQKTVFNENIEENYQIIITNNFDSVQQIKVNIENVSGWDIIIDRPILNFLAKGSNTVNLNLKTNSNFDYATSVSSPDIIVITQKEDYVGTFDFLTTIEGDKENVSLKFVLNIESPEKLNEIYKPQLSSNAVSPKIPLRFSIQGENIKELQNIEILLNFAGEHFTATDTFTKAQDYKIYEQNVPTSIIPGIYNAQVTVRLKKGEEGVVWEWKESKDIQVEKYNDLVIDEISKGLILKDEITLNIKNNGNVDEVFTREIDINFLQEMILFGSDDEYTSTDNGVIFTKTIKQGENITVSYYFNYIPLYIILFVIAIIGIYIYIRKSSNPLDIETKIYDVKKIRHEGVKSMKIRIGFESIHAAEIEKLSIIFRMPSYLNVKDNTFLLTEPNHVLKGKQQYKLVWDFKRFEKFDSRIIGFSLVNKRGILGDIKLPSLEVEVKINGKIRRYYKSFPTIRG